jgi:hypothetical protein
MRRRRPLASLVGPALLVAGPLACAFHALDVGSDDVGPVADGGDAEVAAPDAGADGPLTLEQILLARCAGAPGVLDAYTNAAGLVARLTGRWFDCGDPSVSPIQVGDGVGVIFGADGTWSLLDFDAAHDGVVNITIPGDSGHYRCHVDADPDPGSAAEAGIGPTDIPCGDTVTRSGIVVYLDHPGPDPQSFTFSKAPTQMNVAELGTSSYQAVYVPVD